MVIIETPSEESRDLEYMSRSDVGDLGGRESFGGIIWGRDGRKRGAGGGAMRARPQFHVAFGSEREQPIPMHASFVVIPAAATAAAAFVVAMVRQGCALLGRVSPSPPPPPQE